MKHGVEEKELFSRKEVRAIFAISRSAMWRMERDNILKPTFFLNDRAFYSASDLEKATKKVKAKLKTEANG